MLILSTVKKQTPLGVVGFVSRLSRKYALAALCCAAKAALAQRVGFEPTCAFAQTDFEGVWGKATVDRLRPPKASVKYGY